MSNTVRLKQRNGARVVSNPAEIPRVTPELIRSGLAVASELGAERAWKERNWVLQAAQAIAVANRVSFDTAKAAVLRTVALLAYCGMHIEKLREDRHLWGGAKGTMFSTGLIATAAAAPCNPQGFVGGVFGRLLDASEDRLPAQVVGA
jgi:hypothetical protein